MKLLIGLKKTVRVFVACILCGCLFPFTAFADDSNDVAAFLAQEKSNHEFAETASEDSYVISEAADSLVVDGSPFGIAKFSRLNKGTNRAYSGTYYGYRYAMVAQDGFIVVNAKGYSIVYIPAKLAESLSIDISNEQFQREFIESLQIIDAVASNGGQRFDKLNNEVFFTSAAQVDMGGYTYSFGVEIEEDYYYATITQGDSQDCSAGAIYAETGKLLPAEEVSVAAAPTGAAWLARFLQTLDWSPLWVSLKTTGVAIVAIFILGLLAAWLTVKVPNRVKGILDTLFTIPMVLPPTVCGFLLLMFFGNSSVTGKWLIEHGIDIVFTWPAAVSACSVVGFPMMYRTVRGAFENLDANMLDAARTLGWSELRIFLSIMMPLSWPSIAAGTVLGFARAMGEFGCTLFFAGNAAGITQTLPIAIYFNWMGGRPEVAIFWAIVVIISSFLVILFINIYSARTQKYSAKAPRKLSRDKRHEGGKQ